MPPCDVCFCGGELSRCHGGRSTQRIPWPWNIIIELTLLKVASWGLASWYVSVMIACTSIFELKLHAPHVAHRMGHVADWSEPATGQLSDFPYQSTSGAPDAMQPETSSCPTPRKQPNPQVTHFSAQKIRWKSSTNVAIPLSNAMRAAAAPRPTNSELIRKNYHQRVRSNLRLLGKTDDLMIEIPNRGSNLRSLGKKQMIDLTMEELARPTAHLVEMLSPDDVGHPGVNPWEMETPQAI